MKRMRSKIGQWTLGRVKVTADRDSVMTYWLIFVLYGASTASALVYAFGNPLGTSVMSHVVNSVAVILINTVLFALMTAIIGIIFTLTYLPLPRLLLGSLSYTMFISVLVLYVENSGTLFSYLIGISYSIAALFIGLLLVLLFSKAINRPIKLIVLGVAMTLVGAYLFIVKVDFNNTALPVSGDYHEGTQVDDPGKLGAYDYNFFTYGSGTDLRRAEFGEAVDQQTPTVDSSHFITKWSKQRERFWGFAPNALPINGRVWLPEGEGDFPVFLMVHGNHTMEYLSTSGYDYLGELLASRGIIAISVDEDFINYSNRLGIPNDNYTLRAWMILQHLAQLRTMHNEPGNLLFEKIDFENVALMGHSRGGQAALMATDYETFFEDETELLDVMHEMTIKGVVAISPTDKTIDDQEPSMHNVSYLVLHGARDADVSNYRGDRQFYRSTFDADDDGFKATVYIGEANHTQFNTEWGRMDLSLPRGIFLNQQQTMPAEDQRQVAKVYLAAFLERIFHDNKAYDDLFRDHRFGADWLPEATVVTKYAEAQYNPLIQFKRNKMDMIDASGFAALSVITPRHRRGQRHQVDSLSLTWDAAATYTTKLAEGELTNRLDEPADRLVLRMANDDDEAEEGHIPVVEVELATTDGVSVLLPLADFMPFPTVIYTEYTHFGLFDNLFRDGKYDTAWEPIFQTFTLPLRQFEQENTAFIAANINQLTLHFKENGGKVLIEEIGVE